MILSATVIVIYMFTFGMTLGTSVWPYISFVVPQNYIQIGLVLNWISAAICIIMF